jgi:hypothetical protein
MTAIETRSINKKGEANHSTTKFKDDPKIGKNHAYE